MRVIASTPKDADEATVVLESLHEAWAEYITARIDYVIARRRETSIPPESDAILGARQSTAQAWRTYHEALANLKAAHKSWKSAFNIMTQERQL